MHFLSSEQDCGLSRRPQVIVRNYRCLKGKNILVVLRVVYGTVSQSFPIVQNKAPRDEPISLHDNVLISVCIENLNA
jgi:hypothetical protein